MTLAFENFVSKLPQPLGFAFLIIWSFVVGLWQYFVGIVLPLFILLIGYLNGFYEIAFILAAALFVIQTLFIGLRIVDRAIDEYEAINEY